MRPLYVYLFCALCLCCQSLPASAGPPLGGQVPVEQLALPQQPPESSQSPFSDYPVAPGFQATPCRAFGWNGQVFPHLPTVCPVPRAACDVAPPTAGNATAAPCQGAPPGQDGPPVVQVIQPTFDLVFAKPAHFPLPRFGDLGEVIGLEGAVIYEGMRFRTMPCGRYEVTFAVSTPAIPVTLRLQLLVGTTAGIPFTLTLPPLAIVPDSPYTGNYQVSGGYQVYKDGNFLGKVNHVRYVGFSPAVQTRYGTLNAVVRQGTARFGNLPLDPP